VPSKLPRVTARVSPAARRRIAEAAKKSGLSVGRWAHRAILRALDEARADRRRVCVELDLVTGAARVIGSSAPDE